MRKSRLLIWLILIGVIFTAMPGYTLQGLDKYNLEWSDTAPDQEEEETQKKEMKVFFVAYTDPLPTLNLGLSQNETIPNLYTEVANPPCTPPPEQ